MPIQRDKQFSTTTVIRLFLCLMIFAQLGCSEKSESLAQQRLHEWLPPSAQEVVSLSNGLADDTTFITFICSASDMNSLRQFFARENKSVWKLKPFDRRTADILKLAVKDLKIDSTLQPIATSNDVEYLQLPEPEPYLPAGHAVIVDPSQKRFWYIDSSF